MNTQIENRLIQISQNASIPRIQQNLLNQVDSIIQNYNANHSNNLSKTLMGSFVKHTFISDSDIDALITGFANQSPSSLMNNASQIFRSLNPNPKTHSLGIATNSASIELIPSYLLPSQNSYRLPDTSTNSWIVRNHSQFAQDFINKDNSKQRKISTAAKVLKMWKSHHQFPLTSLFIEKICYDNLKQVNNNISYQKSVRRCFEAMQRRILTRVTHPDPTAPGLNTLSNSNRNHWLTIISRHHNQLIQYNFQDWQSVIGPDF